MRRVYTGLIVLGCAALGLSQAGAITVDELGTGPGETVAINCTGVGTVIVDAGILQLNVGGVLMDGLCIDPFHFSSGSMPGYQAVPLTSAPKGSFMSAATATEIERLWGSYYSPTMSAQNAAGLQIAVWELVGGTGFNLASKNDYGAGGFLGVVQDPNYDGPVTDLTGLTGTGQDYAVQTTSIKDPVDSVPDRASTFGLLALSMCGVFGLSQKTFRLVPCRA
jgi:hypothetical protein